MERKRKIVRQNSKNSSGLSTVTLGTAVRQVLEAEEVWEPEVEAIINFIDGSSASDFAFINDPKRLEALVSLWNEWVSRYSTYSMSFSTLSSDFGVNICSSVGTTRHWIEQGEDDKAREMVARDPRLMKRRYLSQTLYADRQATAISSYNRMLSPVLSQIQGIWILPINKAVVGLTDASQSLFQREQIIRGETA